MQCTYYSVLPKTAAAKLADEIFAAHRARAAAIAAFRTAHDMPKESDFPTWNLGDSVGGFGHAGGTVAQTWFTPERSKAWKVLKKHGMYIPRLDTPAGRATAQAFRALPRADWADRLRKAVVGGGLMIGCDRAGRGLTIAHCGLYEATKDHPHIIAVPMQEGETPADRIRPVIIKGLRRLSIATAARYLGDSFQ